MFIVPRHTGRYFYGLAYAMFLGAGISYWMNTSALLENVGAAVYVQYVWAAFLILGGLSGLVTTVTDIWLGEYAGIMLVLFVMVTYAAAAFINVGMQPTEWAFPLLLVGFGGVLLGNWWRLHKWQRTARKVQLNGGQ